MGAEKCLPGRVRKLDEGGQGDIVRRSLVRAERRMGGLGGRYLFGNNTISAFSTIFSSRAVSV